MMSDHRGAAECLTPLFSDAFQGDAGWARLRDRFSIIDDLFSTPQDPAHHPEGNAGVHTRLVVEALQSDPAWLNADVDTQAILLAAALLHDIGKVSTTRTIEGKPTSPHHASRGAIEARGLLWREEVSPNIREQVSALVRWHMKPNFMASHPDAVRLTLNIAETTRCDWLAILSRADTRGRGNVNVPTHAADFLVEWATELNVYDKSWDFTSDHARVGYFARRADSPAWIPYNDTWGTVIVLAGLPGVGKDRWIANSGSSLPVISLDVVRRRPGNEKLPNSEVAQIAYAEAQVLLGRQEPFIWNATNLYRDLRGGMYNLCHRYHASTRTVLLEADPVTIETQDASRPASQIVGPEGIGRMLRRWDPPDRTETYKLEIETFVRPPQRNRRHD